MGIKEAREELHELNADMISEENSCKCGCCKKQKRREKYKDIIEYIDMCMKLVTWAPKEEPSLRQLEVLNEDIQNWLEEEV